MNSLVEPGELAPRETLGLESLHQWLRTKSLRRFERWLGVSLPDCFEWSWPQAVLDSPEYSLIAKFQKAIRRDKVPARLFEELQAAMDLPGVPGDRARACLILAAAYAAPRFRGVAPPAQVESLLRRLVTQGESMEGDVESDPLPWAWLQIELPLIFAAASRGADESLLAEVTRRLTHFVEQTIEEEGWLPAALMDDFSTLYATLTRSHLLLKFLGQHLEERVEHRLEWMTRNLLRLRDAADRQLLGSSRLKNVASLAKAVLKTTHDSQDRKLLKALRRGRLERDKNFPEPSACCESARVAVLRSGWKPTDSKLGWLIENGQHQFDLDVRETLIQGPCLPRYSRNGKPLQFLPESVHLNCWHSDADADYVEWQTQIESDLIWQRVVVLARADRLALIVDVVLGSESARWDYACSFPTPAQVSIREEAETRELTLVGRRSLARILPISMGEWKQDPTDDQVRILPQGFELIQAQIGKAMTVALAIDLDRRRAAQPATWRHLTVAENLNRVARDRAVAFRIQSGHSQWLAYRSMTANASRSFLGQNVFCEFCLARFLQEGTAESLISVE